MPADPPYVPVSAVTVCARVARGSWWLSERVPDWADRVRGDLLDMGSTVRDIRGQVFAPADRPCFDPFEAAALGFRALNLDDLFELGDAWRAVVDCRQSRPEPVPE